MPTIYFVAPYLVETTLRFAGAAANQPDTRLGLISREPLDKIPSSLRQRLAGHWRVEDPFDPPQLVEAAGGLAASLGPADRLLGILEQLQVPLAAAREQLAIPGMGVETARNFRDKAKMKTRLREAGIPCARHALVEGFEQAEAFAAKVGFPLVAKPPAGAGAKATFRVDSLERLKQGLEVLRPSAANPILLEEFMTGREQSFECFFLRGEPVWHSLTHYRPTPLEVLENPWIQWCILLPREIDDPRYDPIRHLVVAALKALGLETGISHTEWFERPDGTLAISEIAARPPGAQIVSLTSFAHDLDLYDAWAGLMIHERFAPPERRYAAGAAFLRGQGGQRVAAVHGLEQAQAELGDLVVEAKLPRPGQPRSESYEGEGYVILRHPETGVVERGLQRLVSLIRIETDSELAR